MALRIAIIVFTVFGFLSTPLRADTEEADRASYVAALQEQVRSWLVEKFELPETTTYPRIVFTPQDKITALRFRGLLPGGMANVANDIVAVYDESEKTIHLPANWTGASPAEQSVLVHEMVHFLQSAQKTIFECPQAREKLAYKAQAEWLLRSDLSLESEFGLDPFSLLVHINCAV